MVFTRTVRVGGYPEPVRTFPVLREDPGAIEDIEAERQKLRDLMAFEDALGVFRAEVEAYYAGKTDLEHVMSTMMSSMICQRLSVFQ